jgi:hypothetical protein
MDKKMTPDDCKECIFLSVLSPGKCIHYLHGKDVKKRDSRGNIWYDIQIPIAEVKECNEKQKVYSE